MIIGLIGDHNATVTAHQAIPLAIELAANALSLRVETEWIHTEAIAQFDLSRLAGIWCVPASPYANMEAALDAISFARATNLPFLGTCGGYQHAALEFARNALGYPDAGNAEVDPDTAMPLIAGLACRLIEESDEIRLTPGSRIATIYGQSLINEKYHCSYGVNREYLDCFADSELVFSGFDADGDPRALEIPAHRYFIGTAFQPERSALQERTHPLVLAFLQAAGKT